MVLVTGYGPWGEVLDNPAAKLARALDGRRVRGRTVMGAVLEVSWARGPARAVELARFLEPELVIGVGVAMSRETVQLERWGVARAEGVDIEGRSGRLEGPERVGATAPIERMAEAMGASISEDAGAFLCNAWIHTVTRALPGVPVVFVHIPAQGCEPERLIKAIAAGLP